MRLQLIAAIALASAGVARAEPAPDERRAQASVAVYADDDDMLVVSPAAGAQAPAGERATIDLAVAADTVTGASVDVATSASPRAVREQREEATLGAAVRLPAYATITARVIGSHEHDDDVVWGWALAQKELADRDVTVELGWGHGESWITNVVDAGFHARRTDDRATARVTQAIDPRTYVDVLLDLARTAGYQASPYRAVAIVDDAGPAVMQVGEALPRLRHAAAAAVRLRRALGARWFAHGGYRATVDDWSMVSHTADALVIVETRGAAWRFGASARGYLQSAADFWRARYVVDAGAPPALRTRDRALGRMRSIGGALTIDRALRPDADARVQLAIGLTRYAWPDDPLERARVAVTTTIAVTTRW